MLEQSPAIANQKNTTGMFKFYTRSYLLIKAIYYNNFHELANCSKGSQLGTGLATSIEHRKNQINGRPSKSVYYDNRRNRTLQAAKIAKPTLDRSH